MSAENNLNRRNFLKAAASAGIIGTAGCSRGDQEVDDSEDGNGSEGNPDNKESSNDNNTGNISDYDTRIKKGEEFEWVPDYGYLSDRNITHPNLYSKEEKEKVLQEIPMQIYRIPDIVADLSQDQIDTIDAESDEYIGRALADAVLEETGTKSRTRCWRARVDRYFEAT